MAWEHSRADQWKIDGREYDVPDIPGAYLLDALMECGPTQISGGVDVPLSWSEILAYAQATMTIAEPWEMQALARLSREYLIGRTEGEHPLSIAPIDR